MKISLLKMLSVASLLSVSVSALAQRPCIVTEANAAAVTCSQRGNQINKVGTVKSCKADPTSVVCKYTDAQGNVTEEVVNMMIRSGSTIPTAKD
jgi:hypothetical protein